MTKCNLYEKRVCFLEREYLISKQLPKFISILEEFEGYTNLLLGKVVNQVQNGDWSGGADEDFIFWKEPIENIAKKIIKNAADEGVYDLTILNLVEDNPGYHKLHQVCKDTMEGMKNVLLKMLHETLEGYERAERQATSQITGSGVSIWTNSLSSVLLYSAMESSTIKRQCNQADKDFRNAIKDLNARTNSKQEREELRVKTEVYYPGCNEAIPALVSYMLNIYLDKLNQRGVFNYDEVRKYDLAASTEIMKNLQVVSQKEEVLHKAFEKCPYNPDIYKALIDLDLIDFNTFSIAKYLRQDKILLQFIKEYCEKGIDNTKDITEVVRVWAIFEDVEVKDILQKIYERYIKTAKSEYHSAVLAINNREQCAKWITMNITDKATDLINKKDSLEGIVEKLIYRILDKNVYNKLIEFELLDMTLFNLSNKETSDYEVIIGTLKDKLIKQINIVIEEMIVKRESINEQLISLEESISFKRLELSKLEQTFNEKIMSLQDERKQCGIFEFSKKKKLDTDIELMIKEKSNKISIGEEEIEKSLQYYKNKGDELERIY